MADWQQPSCHERRGQAAAAPRHRIPRRRSTAHVIRPVCDLSSLWNRRNSAFTWFPVTAVGSGRHTGCEARGQAATRCDAMQPPPLPQEGDAARRKLSARPPRPKRLNAAGRGSPHIGAAGTAWPPRYRRARPAPSSSSPSWGGEPDGVASQTLDPKKRISVH